MRLSAGTCLGAYEILSPLGAGGMGEVYRARDTRLARDVAIKVLPEAVASSPDRLARFEREARTVAGLNHPNIVVLHSIEEENCIRFLTMELVEGQNLSNLVTRGGLPLSQLLEVAIPLADALAAAHERGVVHRDLKPGNVMVTREGRVKVLDFGLAKVTGGGDSGPTDVTATTTQTLASVAGHVVGTLPYMAPEQIRGEVVDSRTDLFALGIILYELSTGRRPFTGETPADLTSSILRDTPEPLTRIRADLPGDLARIVGRCLEKNPRERVQTALDVANELRALRRGVELGVRQEPAAEDVASIAVLPFANRSPSAEEEYFSEGLADELLNVLSKIRGLRVTARTSSFRFKGSDDDVATIGRKLNVATLLEGSVRRAGNRVRISVQLVKVSDGSHLWSESYDRPLDDIFAVQDDIARSVVKELRTTLLGAETDSRASGEARAELGRAAKGRTTDPEAYRFFLKARYLGEKSTREHHEKGIAYLHEALELDPTYALAWAELGRLYENQALLGWLPADEGARRAREAVTRALALEPNLAEGHARLAWIQMSHDWDWRGAEASTRRALELAPEAGNVLVAAGLVAWTQGRLEEAIEFHRRAGEKDPLGDIAYVNLGWILREADRLPESVEASRKALELNPRCFSAYASIALVLATQGRDEEALAEANREPEEAYRLWALAIVHHAAGRNVESDEALREMTEKCAKTNPYQVAEVYGARGEADAALEWLDRAYVQRNGFIAFLRTSPYLRFLHGEPRWVALLEKMGFEA